jgi:putative oxidoreductase
MNPLERIGRTGGGSPVILIRLLVGWVFVCEGVGKFMYPADQAAGRFAKIPAIPWPEFTGPFVGAVETVFGLLVLLGLLTRVAALILLIDISVALLTTKLPILWGQHYGLPALKHYNLWGMLHESRTDMSMWLGCLFLLIVGGGRWSLDARLFGRSPRGAR